MNINRHNYGAYFLDYHEKNLSPAQEQEVRAFIMDNNDLAEEFSDFENVIISPDQEKYPNRAGLYQHPVIAVHHINEDNFEAVICSAMDNELDANEQHHFIQFINKNPLARVVFNQYKKIRFVPDSTIQYPNKNSLKKSIPVVPLWKKLIIPLSAAASILLLAGIYNLLRPDSTPHNMVKTEVTNNSSVKAKSTPVVIYKTIELPQVSFLASAASPITTLPSQTHREDLLPLQDLPLRTAEEIALAAPQPQLLEALRTTYISIYPDLYIRQMLTYSSIDIQETKAPSLLAEKIQNIGRFLGIHSQNRDNNPTELLWQLADISVQGINTVTNNELDLVRKTDNDGRTSFLGLFNADRTIFAKSK